MPSSQHTGGVHLAPQAERKPLVLNAGLLAILSGEAENRPRLKVYRIPLGPGSNHSELLWHGNLTNHPYDRQTLLLSGHSYPSLRIIETPYLGEVAKMNTLAIEYLPVNDQIIQAVLDKILPHHPGLLALRLGEGCFHVADKGVPSPIKLPRWVRTLIIGDMMEGGKASKGHHSLKTRISHHLSSRSRSKEQLSKSGQLDFADCPGLARLCLVGTGLLEPKYDSLFSAKLSTLFISVFNLSAAFFTAIQLGNYQYDHLHIHASAFAWQHVHVCMDSATIHAADLEKLWWLTITQAHHPTDWHCCDCLTLQKLDVLCHGWTDALDRWPAWLGRLRWGQYSKVTFRGLHDKGGRLHGRRFKKELERSLNARSRAFAVPSVHFGK